MSRTKTLLLLSFSFLFLPLWAQTRSDKEMSDEQIIEYVKEQTALGKGERQIARELFARGVTTEQLERVKSDYDKGYKRGSATSDKDKDSRTRTRDRYREDDKRAETQDPETDRRRRMTDDGEWQDSTYVDWEDEWDLEKDKEKEDEKSRIFGHNMFNNRELTFEPNENMATPVDYRLGPGDEIIIDIWGANESTIREEITPEGNIMVTQIGPIYLNGMTIAEANRHVCDVLAQKYATIAGENPASQVRVTLGQIRSIQVNVLGEVAIPGTYRLSAFSTVFHAIYRAGGVSDIGTLRNIHVMRGGKTVATVDAYDYILYGNTEGNVRLEEGDVVIVSPYDQLVSIAGQIKRPMMYEMKADESLGSLLDYAGGFKGDAYTDEVQVIRRTGRENSLFSVQQADYATWALADGDSVTVGAILDRYANRVEVTGAVYRPGMYELGGDLLTVKDLVTRAEGVKGDAFLSRVLLTREKEDLNYEVISIDLDALLAGRIPDIPLRREDLLHVPSIHELQEQGAFTVNGEVTRPGLYPYADNTTLEDLLIQAGGLLESASMAKIDVSRRLRDPNSLEPSSELSKVFTFSVKDGYMIEGAPTFVLQPYDIVEVRRSPGYQTQRQVKVAGEAVFAGGYTLVKKNERLSDLVERAGGVTPDAYIRGSRLIRRMNEEERAQQEATLEMAKMNAGNDSVSVSKIEMDKDYYTVGIELDKALENPGSDYDVVLREGDSLYIPEYVSTVRIMGEVQYPNTVTYVKGKGVSYYIDQAGGYGKRAKKGSAYVVRMNGTVTRLRRSSKGDIEPGSQIIIPTKKDRRGLSVAEIMSLASSASSIGTLAATIANLVR